MLNGPAAASLRSRLLHGGESLHAPHLIDLEVLHVIRRYAPEREFDEHRAQTAMRDHLDLPIERYPHDVFFQRMWELRENVTAYDAAYIALAEALGATLITADQKLARSVPRGVRTEVVK